MHFICRDCHVGDASKYANFSRKYWAMALNGREIKNYLFNFKGTFCANKIESIIALARMAEWRILTFSGGQHRLTLKSLQQWTSRPKVRKLTFCVKDSYFAETLTVSIVPVALLLLFGRHPSSIAASTWGTCFLFLNRKFRKFTASVCEHQGLRHISGVQPNLSIKTWPGHLWIRMNG